MSTGRHAPRRLLAALLVCAVYQVARAQAEAPKRLRLAGPDRLVGKGALRCDVNQSWDLVIEALDEELRQVNLKEFKPQVTSTNESAVVAKWDGNWNVSILCAGDGQAQVIVRVAGLAACIPVLSGNSREATAAPCDAVRTAAAAGREPAGPRIPLREAPIQALCHLHYYGSYTLRRKPPSRFPMRVPERTRG